MQDYDITTDKQLTRQSFPSTPRYRHKTWNLERCVYDVRHDAYWLVRKQENNYIFTGPISLSKELISLLPDLNELERRDVLKHLPKTSTQEPWGLTVEFTEEDENDGA